MPKRTGAGTPAVASQTKGPLEGHWSIDRAPSRNGPFRYQRSLQGDIWAAIRARAGGSRGRDLVATSSRGTGGAGALC